MIAADASRPDIATLLDWLEGRMPPEEAARIADQVAAADRRTLGTVEWLCGFLQNAVPLHQPPPLVRQNLRQYFARRTSVNRSPATPRELVARIVFDSRRDLALAGIRGAPADDTIHLAYSTTDADLVLDVRRLTRGRIRIDGQVLLADPTTAPIFEASMTGDGYTMRTIDGDEFGRFGLHDIPDTVHLLRASNGEIAIVADLELGAGES